MAKQPKAARKQALDQPLTPDREDSKQDANSKPVFDDRAANGLDPTSSFFASQKQPWIGHKVYGAGDSPRDILPLTNMPAENVMLRALVEAEEMAVYRGHINIQDVLWSADLMAISVDRGGRDDLVDSITGVRTARQTKNFRNPFRRRKEDQPKEQP